jgi:XTP/dITP diphosphohydrolase
MKLYFITSNAHKYTEAGNKLKSHGIETDQLKLNYPEIQADTNEEIMSFGIKWIIEHYLSKIDRPFFIEDAGLFVHSLNNFPGVYSKYVYITIGLEGILDLLSNKLSEEDRAAHFKACIGYFDPTNSDNDNQPTILKGICNGVISHEIRGSRGFGYDPIFIPAGADLTFGEMNIKSKNQYSHRSRGLDKLVEYLTEK